MLSKAVIFTAPNAITVGEVHLPAVGPRDVLIRTECSFISPGTERWVLQGRFGQRRGGIPFPLVPGYQKVGEVLETGAEVSQFHAGQRVFMTTGRFTDVQSGWGGHCEYSVEDYEQVYTLPEGLPSEVAAALVIVQVGWNNGHRPQVQPGDLAVVVGDGLIGQFTAQALRTRGAEVWLAGRREARLDVAARWSADRVIDTRQKDLLAEVLAARPHGADVVVETVSQPENMPTYMQMLREVGQLVVAGYHCGPLLTDLSPFQDKQITVHTTAGWTRPHMEATIADLAAGRLHVEPLITHRTRWQHAQRCYEALVRDKTEDSLGIVIEWGPLPSDPTP